MHRRLLSYTRTVRAAGFTLIELMIVVAVIAILAGIAVPMYSDYVTRSRIIDATSKLGDVRTQMEKCFMDQRTYANFAVCSVNQAVLTYNADPSASFRITWPPTVTATTYLLTATGVAARGMTGFTYTINQLNAKTSAGPGGKYTNAGCWAIRKDGSC